MLDQEYLNYFIVIVLLFMRLIFFLKTAPRMQEDYEIIVIVSMFIIADFLLKLLPECTK
jgi:hypothetical protein